MGFGSWWHWILLILACAMIIFQVLFIIRSRKLIMTEPVRNQFFHPNLTWVCLVPWVNILWVPLTVFAVEKTIARGTRWPDYVGDPVLVTGGIFLKYWFLVCMGMGFIQYLLIYYGPLLFSSGDLTGEHTTTLSVIQNAFAAIYFVIIGGAFASMIWYPIRLGRLLENSDARREAKFDQ